MSWGSSSFRDSTESLQQCDGKRLHLLIYNASSIWHTFLYLISVQQGSALPKVSLFFLKYPWFSLMLRKIVLLLIQFCTNQLGNAKSSFIFPYLNYIFVLHPNFPALIASASCLFYCYFTNFLIYIFVLFSHLIWSQTLQFAFYFTLSYFQSFFFLFEKFGLISMSSWESCKDMLLPILCS